MSELDQLVSRVQGGKKKNKEKKKASKSDKKKKELKKERVRVRETIQVAVIGLGVVGSAVFEGFKRKGVSVVGYDKFKNGGIGSLESCLGATVMFFCLPTLYSEEKDEYDKGPLEEVAGRLSEAKYSGLVVIKSTVEPATTRRYSERYPNLRFAHNPEFLTARTAAEDFYHQDHIVIGKGPSTEEALFQKLVRLYTALWPKARVSTCTSHESEAMKLFVNNIYSYKIMAFNELFLYCRSAKIDYENVRALMLKNGWINPMHTQVPGTDGKLGFGGMCFPKDTSSLLGELKRQGTPHAVLEAVVKQNKLIRDMEY